MSVLFRFSPEGMTSDQYETVRRRLSEGGHWPPDGLEYHVCFGESGQLLVSEIWSSSEQSEAFGQQLMPILEDVGIKFSREPERFEIHNQERF
jgi:hypothetical protein